MKRNTIKAAAAALSAVLLASALPFAAAAAEDGSAASALIRGDSNGDGRGTINDTLKPFPTSGSRRRTSTETALLPCRTRRGSKST